MNATVVELPRSRDKPSAAASLRRGVRPRSTSRCSAARACWRPRRNASRLLLEAPDVRAVIPEVLRLIGEAAGVDRVNLMLSQAGPRGAAAGLASEWVAEGVAPYLERPCDEKCRRARLRGCLPRAARRSQVCLSKSDI